MADKSLAFDQPPVVPMRIEDGMFTDMPKIKRKKKVEHPKSNANTIMKGLQKHNPTDNKVRKALKAAGV